MDKGYTKELNIRIYEHREFGYTIKTNLTLDDIKHYFPTEAMQRAFFARIGTANEGEKRKVVFGIKEAASIRARQVWGDEEWLNRAACRFASESYGIQFTPFSDNTQASTWQVVVRQNCTPEASEIRAAMEVCSTCPVAKECFTKSIENTLANRFGESGIWAGALEPNRTSHLKMRARRNPQEFHAKLGNREPAATSVCTRCLRPANGSEHVNPHAGRSCPGPVTAIPAIDVALAIYVPCEPDLIEVV